jgi:hypothetical protein
LGKEQQRTKATGKQQEDLSHAIADLHVKKNGFGVSVMCSGVRSVLGKTRKKARLLFVQQLKKPKRDDFFPKHSIDEMKNGRRFFHGELWQDSPLLFTASTDRQHQGAGKKGKGYSCFCGSSTVYTEPCEGCEAA